VTVRFTYGSIRPDRLSFDSSMRCWRILAAAEAEIFRGKDERGGDECDDAEGVETVHECEQMSVGFQLAEIVSVGCADGIGRGGAV